jgi:hypothetical protein
MQKIGEAISTQRDGRLGSHEEKSQYQALACVTFKVSQTCFRYQKRCSGINELIADWLIRLTRAHRNWGACAICFCET